MRHVLVALAAGMALAAAAPPPAVHVDTLFVADRTAALKPPLDGQVASVAVREGARVTKGALLVQLDDRQQRARVSLAQTAAGSGSEIALNEVRLREAQARLASTEKAAAAGAATPWELRQARASVDQAAMEARIARDRKSVESRRLGVEQSALESLRIRAPFDGRVTRLAARPGATVRQADTVAVVTDMRTLRGEAYVRARFYGLLKVGQTYAVRFGEPFNLDAAARLTYIDPVVDAGSFRVVFEIANPGETIPSGLEGRVILRKAAS